MTSWLNIYTIFHIDYELWTVNRIKWSWWREQILQCHWTDVFVYAQLWLSLKSISTHTQKKYISIYKSEILALKVEQLLHDCIYGDAQKTKEMFIWVKMAIKIRRNGFSNQHLAQQWSAFHRKKLYHNMICVHESDDMKMK